MSQDFVQLTSPPSVQFVEPGPNPSSQKALANRGHFRGWLVFALTVPAQAASDDGIVVDMRDLTNASALTGEGAQCVSAIGNDILSWDESVNPPVFACVDAIAIQWEAAAFKSELDRQTLEAGFRVVSEAGGLTQRTPLGAHPRACGATTSSSVYSSSDTGPSPRMRGDRRTARQHPRGLGPIPAHAGRPHQCSALLHSRGAHPRACGATTLVCRWPAALWGPSPRMRGDL
jgi:hypothetical protein